jgi:Rieske Fe-S protein
MTTESSMNGFHTSDIAERLDIIITDLAADQRPHPSTGDAELEELALLAGTIRGALSMSTIPAADFARDLRDRLEAELFGDATDVTSTPPIVLSPSPVPQTRAGGPSRRQLVRGGLIAAAGMAAGIVAGVEVGNHQNGATTANVDWDQALVGKGGIWLTVAQVSAVAAGAAVRFSTTQVVGHLVRYEDGSFAAFAAACTHMGCIVDWIASTRTFDCPCHNGRFDAHGQAIPGRIAYRPLPQMQIQIVGDTVQVWVPTASTPASNGGDGTYSH